MSQAPPPPPPHGDNPRTTAGGAGLPTGKYDIFIIPEHSAGSGFLYLPSLKPNWNSFIAGVACTLTAVVIGNTLAPAIRAWWANFQGLGNMGMVLLVIAVGLGSWSLGRTQVDGPEGDGPKFQRSGSGFGGSGAYYNTSPPHSTPPPNQAPPPHNPPPPPPPQPETPKNERPNHSWQDQPRQEQPKPQQSPPKQEQPPRQPPPQPKPQPQPQPRQAPQPTPPRPSAAKTDPKGAWEKAREETRRREEERKAREAELKRKEETSRRLREMREREAREREQREKDAREKESRERERKEQEARERARLEKEVRDKVERELKEKAEREAKEREAREREARERELARMREEEKQRVESERREREAREARERKERLDRLDRERLERERQRKEEEEKNTRKGSSYAFSSVGEKTSMWPNGKPPAAAQAASSPGTAKPASPSPASPTKPTAASARSAAGTEEEAYSFRPYDKPKKSAARKKSVSDFSESSWAPSASTARTSPPPSMREPYTTDDPQKIIIKAVYVFLNQFSKTPASQLVSGVGSVTDGLILRITSAGLFVDDDVRGVAQREWDVKAWTLKQIEVWCPTHALNSTASNTPGAVPTSHPFFKHMPSSQRRAAERGATKTFTGEEAVAYLEELGRGCQDVCRRGLSTPAKSSVSGSSNSNDKSGEWAAKGLHVIRVNIRDQEGKRYLFVVGEEQSWKIAKGLQTLRGGTQVRALGVAGLSGLEAKSILETLGWS